MVEVAATEVGCAAAADMAAAVVVEEVVMALTFVVAAVAESRVLCAEYKMQGAGCQ